jgi:hypothetical protein
MRLRIVGQPGIPFPVFMGTQPIFTRCDVGLVLTIIISVSNSNYERSIDFFKTSNLDYERSN